MYYHRQLEKTVLKAADEFACVTLYGARQTGKSTMVRTMFENIEYVTLDNSRERTLAKQDPELFLESHGTPLIIDEIQKVDTLIRQLTLFKLQVTSCKSQVEQVARHSFCVAQLKRNPEGILDYGVI